MRRQAIVLGLSLVTFGAAFAFAPAPMEAQLFGLGGSFGWTNDVGSQNAQFDSFDFGNYAGWFEYRMEQNVQLRLTGGSLRTRISSGATITEPGNGGTGEPVEPVTRHVKERVNYGMVSVSYLFWEGFFTSGVFGGIGGYGIHPEEVPPELGIPTDRSETVFGWHLGTEGEFTVTRNIGIDLRLTYHNVSAHPHRQFVAADVGATWRF